MKTVTVDMHQILGDRPLYDTRKEYLDYVLGMETHIHFGFANGPNKVGQGGLSLHVDVDDESLPEGVSCESVAESLGVTLSTWFTSFTHYVDNGEEYGGGRL